MKTGLVSTLIINRFGPQDAQYRNLCFHRAGLIAAANVKFSVSAWNHRLKH